ncbi:hypothetical protein G4923_09265 [Aeromonas rivipollensis]|uniref:Uncharacterized protein n=1 Tax=Aeromonas rivipollensis TaxID=948519 RepID=A0ABX0CYP7_9GAMM|nr:hypothetical protein [Aeromonas rivipollensis]NEX88892.1 hypothetical protein [Aeromonas rivipollensis]NEY06996.1 hypothetical protein [Aeromonas rivipollensis]
MKNKLYDASKIYEMIRDYYINLFPHHANYEISLQNKNIFSEILTEYNYKKAFPVAVKINNENFILARSYSVERVIEDMVKLSRDQQEKIINYVDNIFADDFENLMSDIIAMHQWLVQDGYISKSSAGKEKLYMTTKFLNQKSLTI